MADDKSKRGSPDNKRLNKSEPYEVAYAKSKRASAKKSAAAKTGAKKAGAARTGAKRAPAKRAGPARKSGTSASPAMKRSNAAPARARPAMPARGTPNPPKQEKTTENTAPRTMKAGDAVDLLVDDHLKVSALFKQYETLMKKKAPAGQRKTLSQQICDMLKAHTAIEEEIFYPAARKAGLKADLLDEADVEHASAKDLIAQLESAHPDDDHYDAKVKVLGEYITHHVVEEHTEMFPQCRRARIDLVALRAEMESRKMALMPDGDAPPPPARKGESPGLLSKIGDSLFG